MTDYPHTTGFEGFHAALEDLNVTVHRSPQSIVLGAVILGSVSIRTSYLHEKRHVPIGPSSGAASVSPRGDAKHPSLMLVAFDVLA